MEEDLRELVLFIRNIRSDLEEETPDNWRLAQAIENLLKRYKELEEENKGLIESNKEWLKHYSILETESEILKAENEQYKKQFENIKNNILVPSITEKNFIPISVIQNKIEWLKLIADNGMNAVFIRRKE